MPATDRRKVSVRLAHKGDCPNAGKTAPTSTGRGSGCTCVPSWYTLHRNELGKQVKGPRFPEREQAKRHADELQHKLNLSSGLEARRPDGRTFGEWSDTFLEILDVKQRRGSTRRAYVSTFTIAKQVFGTSLLRTIGPSDLRRFVTAARDGGAGDATISKHLRHLGATFEAAVNDGVLDANPVPRFRKELRLRVPRGTEAFTDSELVGLWSKLANVEPVYLALCKAAVTTGARRGELIAATWADLDLTNGVLHVRRHRDAATGEITSPKDHESRDVYLIPPALRLFEEWVKESGVRPLDEPIFTAPRSRSYVNGGYLTKLVAKAMREAGIPAVTADGRPRKPFHAFRATFTRLCREQGRDPQWVQDQLGHSGVDLTIGVYGKWSEDAKRAEAAKVDAGGFAGI